MDSFELMETEAAAIVVQHAFRMHRQLQAARKLLQYQWLCDYCDTNFTTFQAANHHELSVHRDEVEADKATQVQANVRGWLHRERDRRAGGVGRGDHSVERRRRGSSFDDDDDDDDEDEDEDDDDDNDDDDVNDEKYLGRRSISMEILPDILEILAKKPLLLYTFLREEDHTQLFGSTLYDRPLHSTRRRSERLFKNRRKKRRIAAPGGKY